MNVHSVSRQGKRPQNEDQEDIVLNITGKNKKLGEVNFFAVYDGHGGKEVSQYIKDNLSQYFTDPRINYPISRGYVTNVYDHMQKTISKHSFSDYTGSTGVVVIQFKYNGCHYLNVLNVGDSRCVLCRDNFAMPLTKDHKPHWPEELHRIKKVGGEITFDGYDWRVKDLSVSRAFGDVKAQPYVTHRPDLFRYKLDKNDKFIVLACDGLWDVMSNDDVVNFVLINCYDSTTKTRINRDLNIAAKLADYAINKGSTDNVSVIVALFG